jgi:hypothetical protein
LSGASSKLRILLRPHFLPMCGAKRRVGPRERPAACPVPRTNRAASDPRALWQDGR